MSELRLVSRQSPLALAQAESVRARLAAHGVTAVIVGRTTRGDVDRTTPLRDVGGQGVFAVEIQRAVLDGDGDVAVHSAKDLPARTPDGLVLAAVPERRDAADVLVGRALAGLGPGATVATGSPRRRALLLSRRPDLEIVELRGNMDSRLHAVTRSGVDAVVAAAAALDRLGWSDRVVERLDPTWFTPQVGQGALALECRVDDDATRALLATVDDDVAHRAVRAERAFLRELGIGCAVPAGAYAVVEGAQLTLSAIMATADGQVVLREHAHDTDPDALGARVARTLRDERGGAQLEGWRA